MRFNKRTKDEMNRIYRGVGIKLFTAVIRDTPVDTGRLRSNWQCTLDAPASGELDSADKSGSQAIGAVTDKVQSASMENVMILTNNLPYAGRIEYDGWSSVKAPEGMVRRNVERFRRLIAAEVRRKGGGGL